MTKMTRTIRAFAEIAELIAAETWRPATASARPSRRGSIAAASGSVRRSWPPL